MIGDLNACDPLLIARAHLGGSVAENGDILELCRIFLLQFYLSTFGRKRLFALLEAEHEQWRVPMREPLLIMVVLFSLTTILQSNSFRALVNIILTISTRLNNRAPFVIPNH